MANIQTSLVRVFDTGTVNSKAKMKTMLIGLMVMAAVALLVSSIALWICGTFSCSYILSYIALDLTVIGLLYSVVLCILFTFAVEQVPVSVEYVKFNFNKIEKEILEDFRAINCEDLKSLCNGYIQIEDELFVQEQMQIACKQILDFVDTVNSGLDTGLDLALCKSFDYRNIDNKDKKTIVLLLRFFYQVSLKVLKQEEIVIENKEESGVYDIIVFEDSLKRYSLALNIVFITNILGLIYINENIDSIEKEEQFANYLLFVEPLNALDAVLKSKGLTNTKIRDLIVANKDSRRLNLIYSGILDDSSDEALEFISKEEWF